MKMKRLLSLLLGLLLCLLLSAAAFADGEDAAQLSHITDEAGLLSDSQRAALEADAQSIADKYQCGIYIVTVGDYRDYSSTDVTDCAKSIYNNFSLGWGTERDGVLLLLSMADRDYAIIAYGSFGNAAFTDYGKDVLAGKFLDELNGDQWADGFQAYLDQCEEMIGMARNGNALDVGNEPMDPAVKLLLIVALPCLAALIVCGVFAAQMKTARKQTAAADYVIPGSVELRVREDVFTHRTETREIIEKKSGGTSVGSDGFSSKSGKF